MTTLSDDFEKLIEDHARVMSGAIRRVCGARHREHIPDIQQEIRLALWKHIRSGKRIDHPVSYLYKVALTTAAAFLERVGAWHHLPDSPGDGGPPVGRPEPRGLHPVEEAHLVAELLGRLPRDQERAVRAYLAGFNHQEVARLFEWSPSRARHNIYRGLERLRADRGPERGNG